MSNAHFPFRLSAFHMSGRLDALQPGHSKPSGRFPLFPLAPSWLPHTWARRGGFFPDSQARNVARRTGSARPAQGANSQNALARARRVQPRTRQQGKRFSTCSP